MPIDNSTIIRKAAISTGSLASGLLNSGQAKKFLQQTFEATTLSGLIRHELRIEKKGELDKIGIASRIVRKKTEGTDDGYRAGVKTSKIEYSCTAVRLPWEITEETLRENIEGEDFETTVTNLMTTQLGVDMEDLLLNGDEDTPAEYDTGQKESDGVTPIMADTQDYDFLKINDGWIKQILNGGHVCDASAIGMSLDLYYKAVAQMPNKYNNGKLRWLMSPKRAQEWELFLLNQVIGKGGAVPDSLYKSPVGIPAVACPAMPNDKMILTDPKNLVEVNSYKVKIRKTTEGESAIMEDKRFYVVHLDFDAVIEEPDATVIITNLA